MAKKEVVNLSGPEGKNIIGEFTEGEILTFFQRICGWKLIFQNVDLRLGLNRLEGFEITDRGIDFLFAAPNPFTSAQPEGIIVETKRIKDGKKLSVSRLEEHISTLKDKVAGARTSLHKDRDVQNKIKGSIRYGVLAQRFKAFDLNDYIATLDQVDISNMRGPNTPVVLLLANDRLSPFYELYQWAQGRSIEYYYPKYLENKRPHFSSALALNYLFSDIILGRLRSASGYETFILSFDQPEADALGILHEVAQNFRNAQFKTIDHLLFAKGDYDQDHLYQRRLANSPFNASQTKLKILRQDLNLTYNLAEST